jgi:hypothetical protein
LTWQWLALICLVGPQCRLSASSSPAFNQVLKLHSRTKIRPVVLALEKRGISFIGDCSDISGVDSTGREMKSDMGNDFPSLEIS